MSIIIDYIYNLCYHDQYYPGSTTKHLFYSMNLNSRVPALSQRRIAHAAIVGQYTGGSNLQQHIPSQIPQ